uniref:Small ribosomal subunit protein bS20c n=1 Tax=Dipterocladia arabiensis TaxID=2007176 RepID=A0A1Z1M0U3_9FLOR|nr:ribosomal protein S20 [Dipterocladia arabiensis]ARW59385.1 ribosomal protein S20 [Dipterocladia arabiensis]
MSNNLSAVKKIKVASRNRLQNKTYKLAIKKSIKRYLSNLNNSSEISKNLSIVYQKIDKAIKKGILHKNKGARKKARLTQILNQHTKKI